MFDFFGAKVATHQSMVVRKLTGRDGGSVLGLATNERYRLQHSNTFHLTVKTTLIIIHTATAQIILLTLKNTSSNIGLPDVNLNA